jgi:hypothetical protein
VLFAWRKDVNVFSLCSERCSTCKEGEQPCEQAKKKGVHNGGVAKKDRESKVFPFTSISPTP